MQRLLAAGRIPGARKYGASWMIPADAGKPGDARRERKSAAKTGRQYIYLADTELVKRGGCEALATAGAALVPLAEADMAFRRGDAEPAKRVWESTPADDSSKLTAATLAVAAAISTDDYALYGEIQDFYSKLIANAATEADRALLSLPGALAAVSMAVVDMTPQWLVNGDFSAFPRELRPFLLYLYAMHMRNTGEREAMLGIAVATLALHEKPMTFTWLDIYLYVICASAEFALGHTEQAKRYLNAAFDLALPYGFIAPFADHLGEFGGMLEAEMRKKYPQYVKPAAALWQSSFKNWMRFHNAYAKGNITTLLTPQEYQTAYLAACGETYAGTAKRMCLSVSRIKKILMDVYAKLYIDNKLELSKFIL